MLYAHLPQRALLIVSGQDNIAFLQGLISSDARRLEHGEAIYAALLTPQGKFLHDFFLVPWQGRIWIDCEAERANDLRKRLNLYKLRSHVTIEPADETMGVTALWEAPFALQAEQLITYADPRLPQLGFRIIGDKEATVALLGAHEANPGDYDAMRIALGIPDGSRDLIVDKSLLLDWGMDALDGVDFKKGCYVGQEVTARMHYRGARKKSIYQVTSLNGALPESGSPVFCGDDEAGEIRSGTGNRGLAILRIEEVEKSKASGTPLKSGEIQLEASLPIWITPDIIATQTRTDAVE